MPNRDELAARAESLSEWISRWSTTLREMQGVAAPNDRIWIEGRLFQLGLLRDRFASQPAPTPEPPGLRGWLHEERDRMGKLRDAQTDTHNRAFADGYNNAVVEVLDFIDTHPAPVSADAIGGLTKGAVAAVVRHALDAQRAIREEVAPEEFSDSDVVARVLRETEFLRGGAPVSGDVCARADALESDVRALCEGVRAADKMTTHHPADFGYGPWGRALNAAVRAADKMTTHHPADFGYGPWGRALNAAVKAADRLCPEGEK